MASSCCSRREQRNFREQQKDSGEPPQLAEETSSSLPPPLSPPSPPPPPPPPDPSPEAEPARTPAVQVTTPVYKPRTKEYAFTYSAFKANNDRLDKEKIARQEAVHRRIPLGQLTSKDRAGAASVVASCLHNMEVAKRLLSQRNHARALHALELATLTAIDPKGHNQPQPEAEDPIWLEIVELTVAAMLHAECFRLQETLERRLAAGLKTGAGASARQPLASDDVETMEDVLTGLTIVLAGWGQSAASVLTQSLRVDCVLLAAQIQAADLRAPALAGPATAWLQTFSGRKRNSTVGNAGHNMLSEQQETEIRLLLDCVIRMPGKQMPPPLPSDTGKPPSGCSRPQPPPLPQSGGWPLPREPSVPDLITTLEHAATLLEERKLREKEADVVLVSRLRTVAGLMHCHQGAVHAAKSEIRAAMRSCAAIPDLLEESRHTLRLGLVFCWNGEGDRARKCSELVLASDANLVRSGSVGESQISMEVLDATRQQLSRADLLGVRGSNISRRP